MPSTARKTTDVKMPTKTDGTADKRYTTAQFVNKDGSRDMRTTLTGKRKQASFVKTKNPKTQKNKNQK